MSSLAMLFASLPVAVVNVRPSYGGSAVTHDPSQTAREVACFLLGTLGAVASAWFIKLIRNWRQAGERERARAQEAERRFQSIFENAVEGIFQTSPEGKYLAVNPALATIYGYDSPKDLMTNLTDIGRQLYVHPATRTEFKRLMDENDTVSGFEAEICRKDGTTAWICEHARAVRDNSGELIYYEGTVEDITARKRAEAQIKAMNCALERRLKRIEALRNIDLAISSSLDPRLSMNVVMDQAEEQLGVDAVAVWVYGPHTYALELYACKGLASQQSYDNVPIGRDVLGEAALNMEPLRARVLNKQQPIAPHTLSVILQGFTGYAGSPLIAKGQLKGWLEVYGRRELPGDLEWAEYLDTLAGQAAIALDSTTMFRDLQRTALDLSIAYDSTIEGWSKALGLRDEETGGHSERVTDLTLRIARTMGVPEANLLHIRRGALLHDIGKMAVPDAVLLKPGPLTAEEREIMDRHPVCAYEMLSSIAYLRPALDIPYCHHERWDGTGYPRGLKGEETPLAARIFAVVDVWDALTSDRPYRKRWTPSMALENIESLSGTHFDPRVVEVFLQIVQNDLSNEFVADTDDDLSKAA